MALSRIFQGSAFKIHLMQVWDGSVWQQKPNYYNGTSWIQLYENVGNVTVSGEAIADLGGGDRLFRAALVVRATGLMDKIVNATTTQIDAATDWIDPNSDASGNYEVKYDFVSGDALHASTTLADGVWGRLETGAEFFFEQRWLVGAGIGGKSSLITISIRFRGGAALDSASYPLNAERLI